jgi:hypothetical protein
MRGIEMGINVRPSGVIEGLDVEVRLPRGKRVRALVPREVLEERFAGGATLAEWLLAYRRHEQVIDAAIARRYQDALRNPLVVRPSDF